eukprot:GEMP01000100.1.p1 GENE.GEMP01000100.1~~GEMP01000100.1.p1  ORF type:complete len:3200 (+),score=802.61 GEMP01000100.1:575-9601(+)
MGSMPLTREKSRNTNLAGAIEGRSGYPLVVVDLGFVEVQNVEVTPEYLRGLGEDVHRADKYNVNLKKLKVYRCSDMSAFEKGTRDASPILDDVHLTLAVERTFSTNITLVRLNSKLDREFAVSLTRVAYISVLDVIRVATFKPEESGGNMSQLSSVAENSSFRKFRNTMSGLSGVYKISRSNTTEVDHISEVARRRSTSAIASLHPRGSRSSVDEPSSFLTPVRWNLDRTDGSRAAAPNIPRFATSDARAISFHSTSGNVAAMVDPEDRSGAGTNIECHFVMPLLTLRLFCMSYQDADSVKFEMQQTEMQVSVKNGITDVQLQLQEMLLKWDTLSPVVEERHKYILRRGIQTENIITVHVVLSGEEQLQDAQQRRRTHESLGKARTTAQDEQEDTDLALTLMDVRLSSSHILFAPPVIWDLLRFILNPEGTKPADDCQGTDPNNAPAATGGSSSARSTQVEIPARSAKRTGTTATAPSPFARFRLKFLFDAVHMAWIEMPLPLVNTNVASIDDMYCPFVDMTASKTSIVLDIFTDRIRFNTALGDLTLRDLSSAKKPYILRKLDSESASLMQVRLQTYPKDGLHCPGYTSELTVTLGRIYFNVMLRKTLRAWGWIMREFLGALMGSEPTQTAEDEPVFVKQRKNVPQAEKSFQYSDEIAMQRKKRMSEKAMQEEMEARAREARRAQKPWEKSRLNALPNSAGLQKLDELLRALPMWAQDKLDARPAIMKINITVDSPHLAIPKDPMNPTDHLLLEIKNGINISNKQLCDSTFGLSDQLVIEFQNTTITTSQALVPSAVLLDETNLQISFKRTLLPNHPVPIDLQFNIPDTHFHFSELQMCFLIDVMMNNIVGVDPDATSLAERTAMQAHTIEPQVNVVDADGPEYMFQTEPDTNAPTDIYLRLSVSLQGVYFHLTRTAVQPQLRSPVGFVDVETKGLRLLLEKYKTSLLTMSLDFAQFIIRTNEGNDHSYKRPLVISASDKCTYDYNVLLRIQKDLSAYACGAHVRRPSLTPPDSASKILYFRRARDFGTAVDIEIMQPSVILNIPMFTQLSQWASDCLPKSAPDAPAPSELEKKAQKRLRVGFKLCVIMPNSKLVLVDEPLARHPKHLITRVKVLLKMQIKDSTTFSVELSKGSTVVWARRLSDFCDADMTATSADQHLLDNVECKIQYCRKDVGDSVHATWVDKKCTVQCMPIRLSLAYQHVVVIRQSFRWQFGDTNGGSAARKVANSARSTSPDHSIEKIGSNSPPCDEVVVCVPCDDGSSMDPIPDEPRDSIIPSEMIHLEVDFSQLTVMLLNDCTPALSTPFLFVNIPSLQLRRNTVSRGNIMIKHEDVAEFQLVMTFFNSVAVVWEPLIEPVDDTPFQLTVNRTFVKDVPSEEDACGAEADGVLRHNNKVDFYPRISLTSTTCLCLCISETFLLSTIKNSKEWLREWLPRPVALQKQSSQRHLQSVESGCTSVEGESSDDEEHKITFRPYSIHNETGQKMEVQLQNESIQQRKRVIRSTSRVYYPKQQRGKFVIPDGEEQRLELHVPIPDDFLPTSQKNTPMASITLRDQRDRCRFMALKYVQLDNTGTMIYDIYPTPPLAGTILPKSDEAAGAAALSGNVQHHLSLPVTCQDTDMSSRSWESTVTSQLLCKVSNIEGRKVLTVSSPIRVHNLSQYQLRMRLSSAVDTEVLLPQQRATALPILWVDEGAIEVSVDEARCEWSRKIAITDHVAATYQMIHIRRHGQFPIHFACTVTRTPIRHAHHDPDRTFHETRLTIGPPIVLRSTLPLPLRVRVYCLQSTQKDPVDPNRLSYAGKEPTPDKTSVFILQSAKEAPCHEVLLSENIFVELALVQKGGQLGGSNTEQSSQQRTMLDSTREKRSLASASGTDTHLPPFNTVRRRSDPLGTAVPSAEWRGQYSERTCVWRRPWELSSGLEPENAPQTKSRVHINVPFGVQGRTVTFELVYTSAKDEAPVVVVHTPYWLVNYCVARPLKFEFEGKPVNLRDGRYHEPEEGTIPVVPLDCMASQVTVRCEDSEGEVINWGSKVAGTFEVSIRNPIRTEASRASTSDRYEVIDLGVQIESRPNVKLPTRVINVVPRYCVVNAHSDPIRVRQHNCWDTNALTVYPSLHAFEQIVWREADGDRTIVINFEREMGYEWSGPVHAREPGEYNINLRSREFGESAQASVSRQIRVEVRVVKATLFVIFREPSPSASLWHFRNNSSHVDVWYRQSGCENMPFLLLETGGMEQPFGWDDLVHGAKCVDISLCGPDKGAKFDRVSLDEARIWDIMHMHGWLHLLHDSPIQPSLTTPVPIGGGGEGFLVGRRVFMHFQKEGSRKVLIFSDSDTVVELVEDDSVCTPRTTTAIASKARITVNLKGISVSFVACIKLPNTQRFFVSEFFRSDVLFLSLDDLSFDYETDDAGGRSVGLTLGNIQLDDQRDGAVFPVVLQRTRKRGVAALMDAQEANLNNAKTSFGATFANDVPVLQFKMSHNATKNNMTHYKHFEILMQAIKVNIDAGLVTTLYLVMNKFIDSVAEHDEKHEDDFFAQFTFRELPGLSELSEDGISRMFFDFFLLHPVQCNFTLLTNPGMMAALLGDSNLAKAAMLRFIMHNFSIDGAMLKLKSIGWVDDGMSWPQMRSAVVEHYTRQVLFEVGQLIGHGDSLGNPIGFFKHISVGFLDAFYEPSAGLLTGDATKMAEGAQRGAESLFRNTIFATFNSLSKLTQSAANAARAFTMEGPRPELAARHRPRTAMQGVEIGAKRLAEDVQSGFDGVFQLPAEGARQEGGLGFAKGMGIGLVGLVVKPITGVFDFVRHTSEGVSASANIDPNDFTRPRRHARMLHGVDQVLKQYNAEDARCKRVISDADDGKWENVRTLELVTGALLDSGVRVALVCTDEHLICVDLAKELISFVMERGTVSKFDYDVDNGIIRLDALSRTREPCTFAMKLEKRKNNLQAEALSRRLRTTLLVRHAAKLQSHNWQMSRSRSGSFCHEVDDVASDVGNAQSRQEGAHFRPKLGVPR